MEEAKEAEQPVGFDVAVVWCWTAAPAARPGVVSLSSHTAEVTLSLQAAATGKWTISASTPILHATWSRSSEADICGDDGTRGCFILPTGAGILCFAAAESSRGQQLLSRLRTCAMLVEMQLPPGEHGVSLAPSSDAPPDWLVSLLHRRSEALQATAPNCRSLHSTASTLLR